MEPQALHEDLGLECVLGPLALRPKSSSWLEERQSASLEVQSLQMDPAELHRCVRYGAIAL